MKTNVKTRFYEKSNKRRTFFTSM